MMRLLNVHKVKRLDSLFDVLVDDSVLGAFSRHLRQDVLDKINEQILEHIMSSFRSN